MNKLQRGNQHIAGKTDDMRKYLESFENFDDISYSFAHFHAVATRSTSFRGTPSEDKPSGQEVDSIQSARPSFRRVTADGPATQPANAVRDDSLGQSRPKHEPGEPALAIEHVNSHTAGPSAQNDKSSRPDKNLKKLRAAEARRRHELLEEERELQDNLAEFWDSRFDKPRRRVGMTPLDAHTRDTPSQER